MSNKINPIQQLVKEAIENETALKAKDIRALRAESKKAATILKSVFWVGIIVFNLSLWAPLPIPLSKNILYLISFIALLAALIAPFMGLRKHHVSLDLLKVTKEVPKKKTASAAGRVYIDQVKKQERLFINAEFELLDMSKWG